MVKMVAWKLMVFVGVPGLKGTIQDVHPLIAQIASVGSPRLFSCWNTSQLDFQPISCPGQRSEDFNFNLGVIHMIPSNLDSPSFGERCLQSSSSHLPRSHGSLPNFRNLGPWWATGHVFDRLLCDSPGRVAEMPRTCWSAASYSCNSCNFRSWMGFTWSFPSERFIFYKSIVSSIRSPARRSCALIGSWNAATSQCVDDSSRWGSATLCNLTSWEVEGTLSWLECPRCRYSCFTVPVTVHLWTLTLKIFKHQNLSKSAVCSKPWPPGATEVKMTQQGINKFEQGIVVPKGWAKI